MLACSLASLVEGARVSGFYREDTKPLSSAKLKCILCEPLRLSDFAVNYVHLMEVGPSNV
jgi:hypothetical protein